MIKDEGSLFRLDKLSKLTFTILASKTILLNGDFRIFEYLTCFIASTNVKSLIYNQ